LTSCVSRTPLLLSFSLFLSLDEDDDDDDDDDSIVAGVKFVNPLVVYIYIYIYISCGAVAQRGPWPPHS